MSSRSNIQRINRVVDYLNEQVTSAPTLEELADIAGISRFHFHRVFRAVTGETPAGTVRRLRLAHAVMMLKETSKPVTEIAFDVGYESSQAFSKALRAATGHSASELREDPGALDRAIEKLANPPVPASGQPLEVRMETVEPFTVVAARHVGPTPGLFHAFGALFGVIEEIGRAESMRGIYGVPIDDVRDDPDSTRFDCCFDIGPDVEADDRFRSLTLGGGHYVVTRHIGHYDGLENTYDRFFGGWLSESGRTLRDAPFFNHYLADPETLPPEQWETDIYVPIEG